MIVQLVDVNNVRRDGMAPLGTNRLRSQGQDTEFPSRSESKTVTRQVDHRTKAGEDGRDSCPDAPGRRELSFVLGTELTHSLQEASLC